MLIAANLYQSTTDPCIHVYKCSQRDTHSRTHIHVPPTVGDLGGVGLSSLCGRLSLSQRLHSLHLLLALWLCQLEESSKGQREVYINFHQAQLPLYCRNIWWNKFSPMQQMSPLSSMQLLAEDKRIPTHHRVNADPIKRHIHNPFPHREGVNEGVPASVMVPLMS